MIFPAISERASVRHRAQFTFFVSCVAALGGFLFGYDLAIISGAQIFLRSQFHLSPGQFGFAVSSALMGCIAGPILGTKLCDRFGRKPTLIIAGVLFLIGAAGTALAQSIVVFNVFRIEGGVGVGLASLASPMYIAEAAPARRRGALTLLYQLAIVVGCLVATIVSYYLANYLSPHISWRAMFASVAVPVLLFILLLGRVPHGPRWLAEKGRIEDAFQVLAAINGEDEARTELAAIMSSLRAESGTWSELLHPDIRKPLFIGTILALLNNWTGWTGMSFYLPTLFQQAGYPHAADAIGQNVYVMIGMVLLTMVSVYLVDRIGRRPLWLGTSVAMFACLVAAGWLFHHNVKGPLAVVAIFACSAPHAMGLGPIPWLMMSELYPTRIRARAVSITTTVLWIAGFTGPFAFPLIESVSQRMFGNDAGLFWFYALVCMFSFFWGLKCLPETKGRSLEEIADSWKEPSARALRQ